MPARAPGSTKSVTHAIFLRGINVGGKHLLPMKKLTHLLETEGCSLVRTLLQSGNAVFAAPLGSDARLGARLSAALERGCGFPVPVVLRSIAQLRRLLEHKPFPDADEKHLLVALLREAPDARRARQLDPQRSPGDSFVVHGAEVHLHLPNGVARTRLTNAWLDAELDTVSTVRTLATLRKVLQLADS